MNRVVNTGSLDERVRPRSRRRADLPAYLMILAGVWVWIAARLWRMAVTRSELDFAIFYDTGRAFWAGTDLYRSSRFGAAAKLLNLNPPVAVALFASFARLPEPIALTLWMALNAAAFVVSLRLIYRELYHEPQPLETWCRWLLWGSLLMPVLHMLLTANLAWLLMLPATLAWRAARRREHAKAGAWLGLCLMLKPLFLWFLPYWFVRRRWSSIVAAVIVGSSSLVVGWALFGTAAYRSWIEAGRAVNWISDTANVSLLSAMLLVLPDRAANLAWLAAAAAIVIVSFRSFRQPDDEDREWALVWIVSLLVSPLGWLYYYNVAAAPLLAFLKERRTTAATVALIGLCFQELPVLHLVEGHPLVIRGLVAIPFASTALLWCVLTQSRTIQGSGKQGLA